MHKANLKWVLVRTPMKLHTWGKGRRDDRDQTLDWKWGCRGVFPLPGGSLSGLGVYGGCDDDPTSMVRVREASDCDRADGPQRQGDGNLPGLRGPQHPGLRTAESGLGGDAKRPQGCAVSPDAMLKAENARRKRLVADQALGFQAYRGALEGSPEGKRDARRSG